MTAKPRMSANLDLLRAVAVTAVFAHHLALTAWHNDGFETLGRFGVVLFFVHTSCVLMASLERMTPKAVSDLSLAVAFWIRRIFRIYPLAVLLVVTVVVFHIPPMPLDTYRWIGMKGLLANLALSQNVSGSSDLLGPLWTLPVEVQMYLVLPLAYLLLRGGRYRSVGLWLLALAPACLFPHIAFRRPFQVLAFAPCFAAGLMAYDLARTCKEQLKFPAWVWPLGILGLLGIFRPYDPAGFSEKYLQCWALALGTGLLYPLVQEARTNWFYAGCRWIAERSYGIYLTHCVVLWMVFNRMAGSPRWLQFSLLAVGVLGIPALLYRAVEEPFVRGGIGVANQWLLGVRPAVTEIAV